MDSSEADPTHPFRFFRLGGLRFPPPLNVDDDGVARLFVVQSSVSVRTRYAVDLGRTGPVEAREADVDAGGEVVRVEALGALCTV